jgi:hypothetical protein
MGIAIGVAQLLPNISTTSNENSNANQGRGAFFPSSPILFYLKSNLHALVINYI